MAIDYSSMSTSDLYRAKASALSDMSFFRGTGLSDQAMGEYNAISAALADRNSGSSAISTGNTLANSAVSSAQSGVDSILANSAQVGQSASQMRNQANKVNSQAKLVNSTANSVLSTADDIKGLASQMTPYAGELSGIGDTLIGEGNTLWNQSQDIFGQGGALVNMDSNAGGLAGEFIKQYNLLSPDRYVSQAASDVQGAYGNAWDQMVRGNARQGVSPSSGNAQALKKQYATALATALAAAKTKARQTGIDEQTKMLSTMTSAANTLYGMGNTTAQNALYAQNAGEGAKKDAAGVLGSAAAAVGQAGSLQSSAGNLQSSAGQLYASAASIIGSASGLETDQAKATQAAYTSLSGAQQSAANYYLNAYAAQNKAYGNGGNSKGNNKSEGTSASNWIQTSSGRDTSKSGSPWVTTWMNTSTGKTATGDGLFNPNNG